MKLFGLLGLLITTLIGAALGLLIHRTLSGDNYLPTWRAVTLAAVGVGYLGTCWWVWVSTEGWMRWVLIAWMLLVLRLFFLPILEGSLFFTIWCEQLADKLGHARSSIVVHCCWTGFVALLAALIAKLASAVVVHFRRWVARIALMAIIGQGVFALSAPEDRKILPTGFESPEPRPATTKGETYKEAMKDGEQPVRTRVMAAVSGFLDSVSPDTGWGGNVRGTQRAEFSRKPDGSASDRIASIEQAFVKARPYLRTSPSTPQGS